jgi:uncharacterized protein (DUF169 family)
LEIYNHSAPLLYQSIKKIDNKFIIYVNPARMMRLIHGATNHTGKPIKSSFSGRAASRTEGVLGAYLDNTDLAK